MNETTLAALLGRPLTSVETANRSLYLDIAQETLESLLCTTFCYKKEARKFEIREGYHTVFTGIFEEIETVKIDGELTTDYTSMRFDSYNGPWYNSIVLGETTTGTLEVNAVWGFSKLPTDLKLLTAAVFDQISRQNKLDREVNSKRNEDFTITYNHSSITMNETLMESLLKDFRLTIEKYRMCSLGNIRHGEVC